MKILILGHARHGKDTLMEIWETYFSSTYFCYDTSWFCAEKIIFEKLREKYSYQTINDCYVDRGNHRKEWFDLINEYNEGDKARLVREYLLHYDFYVGLRNKEQLKQCKKENLFDLIIWVDASQRIKLESEESCNVCKEMADIVIENNGTLEEFKEKAIRLGKILF